MSSSEGTKDRSSDGAQDGKVDWLRIQVDCQVDLSHFSPEGQAVEQARRGHSCQDACFRMISIIQYRKKIPPAKRLCGAACSPADGIRAGRGRRRGGGARLVGPGVVWESGGKKGLYY